MQSLLESLSNYIHWTPPWDLHTWLVELRLSHTRFMFLTP